MTELLDSAALLVTAWALASAALALAATRRAHVALSVLLDLLTAAGLLRLAADPTLQRAAGAAGVLLVRHLAAFGLSVRPGRAPFSPSKANQNHKHGATERAPLNWRGLPARGGRDATKAPGGNPAGRDPARGAGDA